MKLSGISIVIISPSANFLDNPLFPAEYVYNYIDKEINKETNGRVRVLKVESFEGGTNNSAIYEQNRVNSVVDNLKNSYKNKLTTKQLS